MDVQAAKPVARDALIAIAAGLSIFLVFNAAITWMRQYLVRSGGKLPERIDGKLAVRVAARQAGPAKAEKEK